MRSQRQTASRRATQPKSYYFAMQASWGLTKHMGGLKATKELIELCRVNKDSWVLEVGCGVGITVCYIAKEYGCEVVAVDISEEMIERAKKELREMVLRIKSSL